MTSHRNPAESTTALHPSQGDSPRDLIPRPGSGSLRREGQSLGGSPFPPPRFLNLWGGVLLTSAPLSCWHLLYKGFFKCQHSFFYFFQDFSFRLFSRGVLPAGTASAHRGFRGSFAHFAQPAPIRSPALSGKTLILGKAFDMGRGNVRIVLTHLGANTKKSKAPRRRKG